MMHGPINIRSTGIIYHNSLNWSILVTEPLVVVCEVHTRCVDTSYTRFVFQSGSCQYHSSNAARLPLSHYCYNQKDETLKPGNQRCSFRYRGRWTDEYFHGAAGQTFKSTLSNVKVHTVLNECMITCACSKLHRPTLT
jgi:hypothetical protein